MRRELENNAVTNGDVLNNWAMMHLSSTEAINLMMISQEDIYINRGEQIVSMILHVEFCNNNNLIRVLNVETNEQWIEGKNDKMLFYLIFYSL